MVDLEVLYQMVVDVRDQCDAILGTIADARGDAGADFTPEGVFELRDDAVFVAPEPVTLQPVEAQQCALTTEHSSHLWWSDGETRTYACSGVGTEHMHLMCENSDMHDGHTWQLGGQTLWCDGMPF